jgi:hypothetical protein
VQRYERSGLTQREFAARHQLGLSTLQKWVAQCRAAATASSQALPIWQELKLPTATNPGRWAVELVRPDGLTLRIAHDAPAELIAGLLLVPPC